MRALPAASLPFGPSGTRLRRSAAAHQPGAGGFSSSGRESADRNREGPAAAPLPAVMRGLNLSYLLLLVVLIGGMVGYLQTVEVVVREKRVEQGESRRGLPFDVHVLLTDRGLLPISRLPLIGDPDAAEVYAGIRPDRRYRMRFASRPWSGDRMVIETYPKAQAN